MTNEAIAEQEMVKICCVWLVFKVLFKQRLRKDVRPFAELGDPLPSNKAP